MTTALQGLGSVRTRDINTAISSQTSSPNSSSQLETPFAPSRLTNMDRSLLVRVLNRNLLHQREDSSLQSLSSDPLLTSLPAGNITVQQALLMRTMLPALYLCCQICSLLPHTIAVCATLSGTPDNEMHGKCLAVFALCRLATVVPQLSNCSRGGRSLVVPPRSPNNS